MMKNKDKTFDMELSEKQLSFLVKCIEIAQETHSINPDKEEMEVIRELGTKHDDLQDDKHDDTYYYNLN